MSETPPRPEAKLKNLSDEDHEYLWNLRFKEDGKIKTTLGKIQAEVPLRYGFTVSLGVLSEFYPWLRIRREIREAVAMSDQAKEDFQQVNPDATPDELLRVGQMVFTTKALKAGDTKAFVSLMKAITTRERVAADREKAAAAMKSKIEVGLDALYEEIKGLPAAVVLFNQLKEVVSKA